MGRAGQGIQTYRPTTRWREGVYSNDATEMRKKDRQGQRQPDSGIVQTPTVVGQAPQVVHSWLRRNWLPLIALVVSSITLFVAIGAWLQPQWTKHISEDWANQVDRQIDGKLREPLGRIDAQGTLLSEMKGQLTEISGLLKIIAAKEMTKISGWPISDFSQNLPEVKDALLLAKMQRLQSPKAVISAINDKLLEAPKTRRVLGYRVRDD
jgi:hypothetical protein